jgi:L-alanine-DL-glutamate epimerase-like enolase superfamily enzyme
MMAGSVSGKEAAIQQFKVSAYTVPTDFPEADGTYSWKATTLVLVEVRAADHVGIGYSYADLATAKLINKRFRDLIINRDAMAVMGNWQAMVQAIRNLGRPGIASMAIAAVDIALWDLKCRLLGLPLVTLLGAARKGIAAYGSGGFTTYTEEQLRDQLGGWAKEGLRFVKMKIGMRPDEDLERVRVAREAVGPDVELFVDANGAYARKQALRFAADFAELGVSWFEEPVPSDDLEGLHLLRDRGPAGMSIAAGEYGYDLPYFRRMLDAGAVDVLQADATRCAGITGFLQTGVLCQADGLDLSAHCAPSIHVHPCCSVPRVRHLEYFHDHVCIEHMLFDGALSPVNGVLYPDLARPGLGLEFKHADARRYEVEC